MQRFFFLVFIILLNPLIFQPCVAQQTNRVEITDGCFIQSKGTSLAYGKNIPVHLKGVNLGGWLLWEGWIWGKGFISETTIFDKISAVVGKDSAKCFGEKIHHNFIKEDDIKQIAACGFNVVRVPFNHLLLEDDSLPYHYKNSGWLLLDSVLGWCRKYNVFAVLDLHSAPGGQNNFFIADPDKDHLLWNDTLNPSRTVALWKAIASHYKNNPAIAGYDLLNEPKPPSGDALLVMYKKIIRSIREVDPNHAIILEGNSFATDFSMFKEVPDSNAIFSFHLYTWLGENPLTKINNYKKLLSSLHAPFWCGEWGENKYAILETTAKTLNDPDNMICGSAFWTWKKVGVPGKFPGLCEIKSPGNWDEAMAYISNPFAKKYDAVKMQRAIRDFLSAAEFPKTYLNTQTLKAITIGTSNK